MTLVEALKILGLTEAASAEEIIKAWRKACMLHHPDRGGNQHDFLQAKEAHRVCMTHHSSKQCPRCNGLGKITMMMGLTKLTLRCARCNPLRKT